MLAHRVEAIDPERALSQYIHDRWGAEQGFPGGPVSAIAQTPDGYLWIGTEKGLARFDGHHFRLYTVATPMTLPIGPVLGLSTDAEGALWVRLHGPNVLRYREGRFENVASVMHPREVAMTAMTTGRDGNVLVAMLVTGTLRYGRDGFRSLAPGGGLPNSTMIAIAEDPDGVVWLGTRDAGLFTVANGRVSAPVAVASLPDRKINCLLAADRGEVWIGTDNGVGRWRRASGDVIPVSPLLERIQALAMTRDRDGNVWVGTATGIVRIDAHGTAAMDDRDRSAPAAVTAIFEDREGGVWIGGAHGLERFRDSVFVTYSAAEGLPSDTIGPVYVDPGGRTWFAPTEGGGLYRLDPGRDGGRIRRVEVAGLGDDVVYSITGGEGEIWLGRQRGGLTRLRESGGAIVGVETFTQPPRRPGALAGPGAASSGAASAAAGLAQNSVYAVTRARDGSVWAGTLSGGASRFKDGRFTTYTVADGLASNTITSILEAADGTIWFGTSSGVSALADGRWRTFTMKEGLPSDSVHCLFEDADGTLWIGTAGGVAFRSGGADGGSISLPSSAPPRLRDQILGIADDRAGSLWIATASRLLRVQREALRGGAAGEADVHEFGLADGLRGLEGVRRDRSLVRDARGRVWVALNRGLSVVDPSGASGRSAPAIVQMQDVSGDGRQRITFSYAGLSLAVPSRVRYRYRLDGFDTDWSAPVTAREAVYTNLGPGPYHFRVMACNSDGLWNGAEAGVRFEIAPLFWQTAWFRSALLAAGVLVALGLYRVRIHQVRRQLNVRFEERLAERTHLAQELHDTLLQGFVSASMQLHVAADQLPSDSPAAPRISRVLELMRQVIEEGRHAVAGLRSSADTRESLEQALSHVPQELAVQAPTGFRVLVEGQTRPLHPLIRDEVYRIAREALANAFRHARARTIEVALEYAQHQLRVLVRDDGVGMDVHVLQSGRAGHFGLSGMRERAERIGARLTVWSRSGAGTEIELIVPGQRAFAADPSAPRARRWWTLTAARRATSNTTTRRSME